VEFSVSSAAVPDGFTEFSVDAGSVNEDMDLFSLDSSLSHYDFDCALQNQDFYLSTKKEMSKVNKVMANNDLLVVSCVLNNYFAFVNDWLRNLLEGFCHHQWL